MSTPPVGDLERALRALHDKHHPVPACPFCTYGMACKWLEEYRAAAVAALDACEALAESNLSRVVRSEVIAALRADIAKEGGR